MNCPQCKRNWASGTICPYCCELVAGSSPASGSVRPCCGHMNFALKQGIIRTIGGYRFGSDVLPSPLDRVIVACPWCGVAPN